MVMARNLAEVEKEMYVLLHYLFATICFSIYALSFYSLTDEDFVVSVV